MRAEVHVPPVIQIQELERFDKCSLADVIRPDDLQRAGEFNLCVFIEA